MRTDSICAQERRAESQRKGRACRFVRHSEKPCHLLKVSRNQTRHLKSLHCSGARATGKTPDPGVCSCRAGAARQRRLERAEQEINGTGSGSIGWMAWGIAGAAGKAWSYITDEAAMLDAAAPPPSVARPPMSFQLSLDLPGTSSLFRATERLVSASAVLSGWHRAQSLCGATLEQESFWRRRCECRWHSVGAAC